MAPLQRIHRLVLAVAVSMVTLLAVVSRGMPGAALAPPQQNQASEGSIYGGNKEGQRFSRLTQINAGNVHRLRTAWTYDTGETGGLQTQPLILGRTMFVYTPSQKIAALDAGSGKEIWRFDPNIPSGQPDRGFAVWSDGKSAVLFAQTLYALWALNPATGKPIPTFGTGGMVDLRKDLGAGSPAGLIAITTPGVVYKDTIIMGFRTAETEPAPHGDIRAYDVHTGVMRWAFHTIPHPGEPGYETWPAGAWKYTGGANSWTGMALDEKRGLLFAPTGSAVTDFYGADRAGNDLYANTLLALDANTGSLIWHFQAVHHDIWDRDFPSPPTLVTVRHNGKPVDAVAQTTKHGFVFLFDRTNGKPLFPIEEKPFPASTLPGEWTSPTQPVPALPAPYARQRLTADMLTDRTPAAHADALKRFKTFRSDGIFVPLSVGEPTVVFPGFDGGAEWGGSAVDPRSAVLYLNSNDIAWTGAMGKVGAAGPGATTYGAQCAVCHGPDRAGQPPAFPSLVEATQRLSETEMVAVIHNGRGRMPGFPQLDGNALTQLLQYVRTGIDPETNQGAVAAGRSDKQELSSSNAAATPYRFLGYRKFLDPDGYPAVAPPWGTLNAIDLNTGRYLWKIPFGEYPDLAAQGMKNTGSENYGGPLLTASSLLFIGATNFDRKMRAFDSRTGRLLWEYVMEGAGNATPSTYMVDGKQYIVIAISNARNPKAPALAKYVAFALE